jgi:hypothetical protein
VGVEHGRRQAAPVEGIDLTATRLVDDRVRAIAGRDSCNRDKAANVDDAGLRCLTSADTYAPECMCNCDTVHARGIGNVTDERVVIDVDDVDVIAMGDIQTPRIGVDRQIVLAAIAGKPDFGDKTIVGGWCGRR